MNKFEELHDNITKLKGCVQQASRDLYNAKKEWCTKVLQENFSEFLNTFYWYHSSPIAFYIDEVRCKNPTFDKAMRYMSESAYMNIYINELCNFAWNGLDFMLIARNEKAFNTLVERCEKKCDEEI